ncbi:DNA-formamidopyrimidine glycosylase [Oceanobacillus iheyensis]|uniref:Formamidopyrimidine-DNA glycosylase n=1 Tax=Oceanobacillus iheyensis (strain DSM 14371 / CIP 107618 / JCM 11309 / KCTC 3954 / HTE831) TaxID=221109 RepID=FPG_OCEIH|nr:DNA-formamidopyrimidine glycosylase [Oceanobacillus iheyensis]Q8EPE6.3 RecName: Full=Formamidopyrimidine-DNA glycosylase; Short=Fapy-DNA glycosylase; AltName: Full=DNA-(apurinic or apyrimidinic site) lyase MutM; Short=AP lyase MutM [Oceanobacillus iheyensis HTE831]BAC14118.1 formamidopyrimidine-DNA glycosidase [Oceanobacillus iheyensis HTE831]
MPELPEVETIKETLKLFVCNKTIKHIDIEWPNMIKHPDDVEEFKALVTGQTIRSMGRKGKFLLFYLDEYVLISHLRMEGKYSVHSPGDPVKKHTHVTFYFSNGEELRYNDVRKFGTMHVYPIGEEFMHKPLNQLGPDPFDTSFNLEYFYEKLKRTDRYIKTALLDQSIVTGLGNIYVDETLFRANVHPLKRCSKLSKQEVKKLQINAKETLRDAIKAGGTTIRSYVNTQGDMGMFQQDLYVYGQHSKPCRVCGADIIKIKVGGRGTHLCPTCQPNKQGVR